jgi:poly-gamma-glutamate synthesis protein (capsule biosynthesis protein)
MKVKNVILLLVFFILLFAVGLGLGYSIGKYRSYSVATVANSGTPAVPVAPLPEIKSGSAAETTLQLKKSEVLRITAVGDIMLGRGVGSRLEKQNKGYKFPFEKVGEILGKGDIIFGNLEAPITESTKGLDSSRKIVLKSSPSAFEALSYAGFNLVSLANNHILDYYEKGLFDTFEILNKGGIKYSGAGKSLQEARKPTIIERKGIKTGLLSYTDMAGITYLGNPSISFGAGSEKAGVIPLDLSLIKEDVAKARDEVDILIVSLHWGIEESFEVSREQVEMAHEILDCGADIILGHHPHQFQGIEIYKGKPIFYSLGNFIFDQNDPENQQSFIINMEFTERKLGKLTAIPVETVEKTQVVPQTGESAQEIIKREIELSSKLNTGCRAEGDILVFDLK